MITSIEDLKPIEKHTYNIVVNEFDGFTELVYYKKPFFAETGNFKGIDEVTGELILKNQNIDRSRKFEKTEEGFLKLKEGKKTSMSNIAHTIKESRKRALDNIFAYALCNEWKYFLTLTFSPEFVNREIDQEVINTWKKFKRQLQNKFKDVTILAIPERHPTSNALHLHCLIGNCDLKPYCTKAINKKTNKPIVSNGRQVYNLNLFTFGFSTLVNIDSNPLKVANYLTKYVIKDFGNIGYNKKSHFRTRNLKYKNKKFYFCNETDFMQTNLITKIINNPLTIKYKETDKLTVYRFEKNTKFKELDGAILPFFATGEQIEMG